MKRRLLFSAFIISSIMAMPLGARITEMVTPIQKEVKFKNIPGSIDNSGRIDPHIGETDNSTPNKISEADFALREDFEGWDGLNDSWLPEGWTIERRQSASEHKGWRVYTPVSLYEEIKSTCMLFDTFNEPVDEWLITPEIRVADGMQLSWLSYPSPIYYFDPTYIDWTTYSFTEMHIINDFKVWVSDNNGQSWNLLKSVAEDYLETTGYFDLASRAKPTVYNINLSAYAGKDIIIGFNVVGEPEGNTAMVDDVTIGFPELNISYDRPAGSLFFGLSKYDEYLPASILVTPVYKPVTFINTSKDKKVNFSWTYTDTTGEHFSNSTSLTVTYGTDYTSDYTTRNNLYDMPLLTAQAEKYATTEYSYPAWLQAGGKAEYEIYYTDSQEREIVDLGLGILDPVTEGTATYADIGVPYFGYNQSSDYFWTNYMLNGDPDLTMDENNYSHLIQYGNLMYTSDSPLVINGIRTNAYGKISKNVEMKAHIYLVDKGFAISEQPYVTAVCLPEDITIIDRYSSNDFLSFYFRFEEPVVISADITPYYFVTISGFRDAENVEYFSPEMSDKDNRDKLAFGWVGRESKLMGTLYPMSWGAVYDFLGQYVSFYIMLDAAYTWLECDTVEIKIGPDGKATLSLDSYYSSEQLEIDGLPEWLSAECSGRYGETKIVFTSTSDFEASAIITVGAPGIEKKIKVSTGGSNGIGNIELSDLDGSVEIYTLTGLKVTGTPAPGLYIIRQPGGRSFKSFVR